MKKILLVAGGNSGESEISVLTMLRVYEQSEINKFHFLLSYFSRDGQLYTGVGLKKKKNYLTLKGFKKATIIKKDGCYYLKSRLKKEEFEIAFPTVHGKNAEDGTIASFFKAQGIKTVSSNIFSSAIIQDKAHFKELAKCYHLPQTNFVVVRYDDFRNKDLELLKAKLSFPLVIKPSHLGSSLGIEVANNIEELRIKMLLSFKLDDVLILEEAVFPLIEYNVAILGFKDSQIISAIEMVNSKAKVLSFEAKYDNKSDDFIKHDLHPTLESELAIQIKKVALKTFELFECQGVVRFDFLYQPVTKKLYLNEPNSIPGSLAYYLFEPVGISFEDLLLRLIDGTIKESFRESAFDTNNKRQILLNDMSGKEGK